MHRLTPELLTAPSTRALYAHWHQICAGRRTPLSGDFDPLAVPPALLPDLLIIEVVESGAEMPPRYRLKLLGGQIRDQVGVNLAGMWIDEIYSGDRRDLWLESLNCVYETRRPVAGHSASSLANLQMAAFEWVLAPLAQSGTGRVERMIGAVSFGPEYCPSRHRATAPAPCRETAEAE